MHRLRLARVVVTPCDDRRAHGPGSSRASAIPRHAHDSPFQRHLRNRRASRQRAFRRSGARVATVIDELKHSSTALLTTLAGDYLAPSALGTARVNGEPLAGKQMVAVLNAIGLDWATLGNHEFDVSEAAFARAHHTSVVPSGRQQRARRERQTIPRHRAIGDRANQDRRSRRAHRPDRTHDRFDEEAMGALHRAHRSRAHAGRCAQGES